jgi:predicted HTH transcriptional regulator
LLRSALEHGESSTAEFKESLRWDFWKGGGRQPDEQGKPSELKASSEAMAVKTVAGFLNSRLGGNLIIGVADDKKVVGLDRDYDSLVKPDEDQVGLDEKRDRFQLHWGHLLGSKIGHDISNLCVETALLPVDGRDVCVVRVNPAPSPVYVTDSKGRVFYLRVGAETVALDVEKAVAYCRERWPGRILGRILRLHS